MLLVLEKGFAENDIHKLLQFKAIFFTEFEFV